MTTKASGRFLLIAVCAVLGLAACKPEARNDRPPETGDMAVARVNDDTIWLSDLKREAVAQGLIGDGEPLDVSNDLFQLVLNSVIDQKLLAAEARRQGLDKDAEVLHRLKVAQDRILGDILLEREVQESITGEAINAAYQQTLRNLTRGEEFRARIIVSASREEADAIRSQIAAGAEFASLALSRSSDASTRFDGGDLGYFTPDLLPDAYGLALRNAKAGDIVGPFQVEQDWVVLKVEDRRPEQPLSLEAARPQIVRFLTLDEVRETLENARRGAKIDVLVDQPAGAPREPADAPASAPGALGTAQGQADAAAAGTAPAPAETEPATPEPGSPQAKDAP